MELVRCIIKVVHFSECPLLEVSPYTIRSTWSVFFNSITLLHGAHKLLIQQTHTHSVWGFGCAECTGYVLQRERALAKVQQSDTLPCYRIRKGVVCSLATYISIQQREFKSSRSVVGSQFTQAQPTFSTVQQSSMYSSTIAITCIRSAYYYRAQYNLTSAPSPPLYKKFWLEHCSCMHL